MVALSDQGKDVIDFLVPIIRNAERDAQLVVAFLDAYDVAPAGPDGRRPPVSLSADLLLKISAWVRLYQWEREGVRPWLRTDLPPAHDVLEDVLEGTKGFSGRALSQAVMRAQLLQLACSRRLAVRSDVVVAPAAAVQVLDAVADFLWQVRHLAASEKQP